MLRPGLFSLTPQYPVLKVPPAPPPFPDSGRAPRSPAAQGGILRASPAGVKEKFEFRLGKDKSIAHSVLMSIRFSWLQPKVASSHFAPRNMKPSSQFMNHVR